MKHPPWTRDSILAAVVAFVADHGTYPAYLDFHAANGLPAASIVDRVYRSATEGGLAALRRAYVALAHPSADDAPPNWCLRCQQVRLRRGVHLCRQCQEAPPVPDGSWMSGVQVPEDYWDLTEWEE